MEEYIKKAALVAEIKRRIKVYQENFDKTDNKITRLFTDGMMQSLKSLLAFFDTFEVKEVEEEPVSNDLEEAIKKYLTSLRKSHFEGYDIERAFKKGAQWQKEQTIYKACNYLFSHMGLFVTFFDDDIVEDIERSEFIKKFRIAMEGKL